MLHSAPIAFEMSRLHPGIEIFLIVSSDAQYEFLLELASGYPGHRCHWIRIGLPRGTGWLFSLVSGAIPFEKLAKLKYNAGRFRDLDALVVTEKTSLLLKTSPGLSHLRFIHARHGAGDRAIGFNRESGKFDLVLVSGEKIRDRLMAAGQLREGYYAITGYAKFDAVDSMEREPLRLFENDRPTVLYNPHFSPELSSWYRFGQDILEYFYQSKKYNLIFSPHIMLFEKKLHIPPHSWRIRRPGSIPRKFRECPHMHIDTGSRLSIDMSYTLAADLYLGDVSSQVYEFLVRPRPCVFANPGVKDWENDPNYLFWQFGPVFDRVEELDTRLREGFESHSEFLPQQRKIFAYTFDVDQRSSAERSAQAIADYLRTELPER